MSREENGGDANLCGLNVFLAAVAEARLSQTFLGNELVWQPKLNRAEVVGFFYSHTP